MSPAKKTPSKKKTTRSSSTTRGSKTNARKSSAKKTSARKTAAASSTRKSAAKKTSAKKKTTKKATAKKSSARKTQAKKTTQKKTTAKSTRRRSASAASSPKPVTRRAPSSPGGASPARPARRAKLDKRALAGIKKTLEDQRADLLRQQAELQEDSFDSTQSDLSGEVGFDEDFADAGTATFDRERDLSIRNNIQDLIDQISRAIARIDDGTYGTCERCGRPIDAARLKALPHALLCMNCKRREERAR